MEIVCFDFHPPANLQKRHTNSKAKQNTRCFFVFSTCREFIFSVLVLCLPLLVSVLTLVEFFNKNFPIAKNGRKNNRNFQLYLTAKLESNYRPSNVFSFSRRQ
jgi:hypothetical protein